MLHVIETLSILPYGLGIPRHYRDSSLINDHQSDMEIHDDPCAFTEVFCH
jgi:hypothetical protein